jgi:hypothetical protein
MARVPSLVRERRAVGVARAELVQVNKIPSAHNWSFGATSAALQKQPLNQLLELAHCSAVIGSEPMKPLQDLNPVVNSAVGEE